MLIFSPPPNSESGNYVGTARYNQKYHLFLSEVESNTGISQVITMRKEYNQPLLLTNSYQIIKILADALEFGSNCTINLFPLPEI